MREKRKDGKRVDSCYFTRVATPAEVPSLRPGREESLGRFLPSLGVREDRRI